MHRWSGVTFICLVIFCGAFFVPAMAQEQENESLDSATTSVKPADGETSDIDAALEQSINKPKEHRDEDIEIKPLPEVKDVSGLGRLSQFEDIAVIQKRYLPKTSRFELYPNLGFIINDAFFNNTVASGRLGFYFSESISLELNAMILGTSERSVTTDLNERRGVTTRSLVTPQSYYGADIKWSPIYGKTGLFNTSIIPFDLYFSLGGGQTKTNQGQNATTIHLGTGQTYAWSKWAAFRWDLSWYWYKAQATTGAAGSFTNIYAMVGVSFFIPEARYR